jgi:hypothetical protein
MPIRAKIRTGGSPKLSRSLSCHQRAADGCFRRRNRRFKRNSAKFRRTNFVTGEYFLGKVGREIENNGGLREAGTIHAALLGSVQFCTSS